MIGKTIQFGHLVACRGPKAGLVDVRHVALASGDAHDLQRKDQIAQRRRHDRPCQLMENSNEAEDEATTVR